MLAMFKLFITLFALATITGCGSSTTNDSTNPQTGTNAYKTVNIVSLGDTVTINESVIFDLNVTNNNNTITISSLNDIDTFNLTGSNNLITFAGLNNVGTFNITGSDNTIYSTSTSSVSITNDTGSGNQLIVQ